MKFSSFDIQYSLFDLPAMPLIGFEMAPQMLINATVIIARPSTCMAGGYSAVLFSKPLCGLAQRKKILISGRETEA